MEYAFLKTKIGFTRIVDGYSIKATADSSYAGPSLEEISDMEQKAKSKLRGVDDKKEREILQQHVNRITELRNTYLQSLAGYVSFHPNGEMFIMKSEG